MTKRGRKPKPIEVRRAEGNPGKRKMPKQVDAKKANIETVDAKFVAPPSWLDVVGKAEWKRIVRSVPKRLITAADHITLAAYCHAYSEFRKCYLEVKKPKKSGGKGRVIETDTGYLVQSPWVSMMNTARKEMIRIAAEFGFTPSSRAGLSLNFEEEDSKKNDVKDAVGL